MKIKDLPQPYRTLAEMRREQQINSELFRKEVQYTKGFEKDSLLKNAFCWNVAREGSFWWYDLDNGKLPGIPAESLAELGEWQKEKQCFDCKGDIDKEGQCFCNKDYEATVIAEQPNALKKAWDEGRLRTIEMLNAGKQTNPLINKDYCCALNPYGEIKTGNDLHITEPDPRLFQAALAAMQGMLSVGSTLKNEPLSVECWDLAEALINEGKKRGHL